MTTALDEIDIPDLPPPTKPRYDRSIVDGPLNRAVWKIAWPTMLTNMIGGLQGIVDHALVGNLIGFKANAAIGVAWQIFIVVIVFIIGGAIFSGMAAAGGGGGADEFSAGMVILLIIGGLVAFGAGIGALVGQVKCTNVPEESGAKGYAVGAIVCIV